MTADFTWGAKAIAKFLRDDCGVATATPKMVYHWAARSVIPIATVNRKLVISRATVLAYFTAAIDVAVERCQAIPLPSLAETETAPPAAPQGQQAPITASRARGPRHRIR
jgi:hypothetical protein